MAIKMNTRVQVVKTGDSLIEGAYGVVKGVAFKHLITGYIVLLDKPAPLDGEMVEAITMTESCLNVKEPNPGCCTVVDPCSWHDGS